MAIEYVNILYNYPLPKSEEVRLVNLTRERIDFSRREVQILVTIPCEEGLLVVIRESQEELKRPRFELCDSIRD